MALRRAFLALAVLTAPPLTAHEGHKSPAPPPSQQPSPVAEDAEPAAGEEEDRPQPPPLVIDARAALFHHMHNKIVHFPIALGSIGALLLLLSYRWPQFGPGARVLLVIAALTAWMAVRSGEAQEADLEGGELGAWLDRHEDFGKWAALALSVAAIAALVKQARPVQWLLALVALGLVGYAAFLGGILAHTPV
jgi:uncharacterized membrane protein